MEIDSKVNWSGGISQDKSISTPTMEDLTRMENSKEKQFLKSPQESIKVLSSMAKNMAKGFIPSRTTQNTKENMSTA